MKSYKRIILCIVAAVTIMVGLTACSSKENPSYKELPETLSERAYVSKDGTELGDEDVLIPVDFYFDNLENTACLKHALSSERDFVGQLLATNDSFFTKEFVLEKHTEEERYHIVPANDKINLNDNDLYITNSTPESRLSDGILKMLFFDEESPLDTSHVSVIFTDLAEPEIVKTATEIRRNYLTKDSTYGFCMLSSCVSVGNDWFHSPVYIATTDESVKDISSEIGKVNVRNYTTLIFGPRSRISRYLAKLKSNLSKLECGNDKEEYNPLAYYMSDYRFHDHSFTVEDLNISYLTDVIRPDVYNRQELFDTKTIRLLEPVRSTLDAYLRPQVKELVYDEKVGKSLGVISGYNSWNQDFALNVQVEPRKMERSSVYFVDLKELTNGEVQIDFPDELKDSEQWDTGQDVAVYTLGALSCYVDIPKAQEHPELGLTWNELQLERADLFFQKRLVSGNSISVISNNAYDEEINNIYLTVPVYEIVMRDNYVTDWVSERDASSQKMDEGTGTRNYIQFYSALSHVDSENTKGEILYSDAVKYTWAKVGSINILIRELWG